jgi:hypothetical protein
VRLLPFIPVEEVIPAVEWIRSISPENFIPVLDYFEATWVGKRHPTNPSLRFVPSFPIRMWSVHDRVLKEQARTNNSLEAWHNAFEMKIGAKKSIYTVILKLKSSQHKMDCDYQQTRTGRFKVQEKKNATRDARVKRVVMAYEKNDFKKSFFTDLMPALYSA